MKNTTNKKSGQKPTIPIVTTDRCSYGCGETAKYKSVSGKLLCSKSPSSCQAIKKKNSEGAIASYKKGNRVSGKEQYRRMSEDSKNRMIWNRGLTAEQHPSIARGTKNRKERVKNGEIILPLTGVAADPSLRWKRNYIDRIDSFGNTCRLESKLEATVADILDSNNIKWIRPKYLKLSDNKRYEPDFYLVDYDVYIDPKGLWCKNQKSNQSGTGKKIIDAQTKQLEKIKRCREELGVKIVILYQSDKRINSWQGILDIIKENE